MVQQALEVLEQCVSILLNEASDAVNDIAGIVRNSKVFTMLQFFVHWLQLSTGVVGMVSKFLIHCIEQCFIGNFSNGKTCLVYDRNYALVRLFDKVTNNLSKRVGREVKTTQNFSNHLTLQLT